MKFHQLPRTIDRFIQTWSLHRFESTLKFHRYHHDRNECQYWWIFFFFLTIGKHWSTGKSIFHTVYVYMKRVTKKNFFLCLPFFYKLCMQCSIFHQCYKFIFHFISILLCFIYNMCVCVCHHSFYNRTTYVVWLILLFFVGNLEICFQPLKYNQLNWI